MTLEKPLTDLEKYCKKRKAVTETQIRRIEEIICYILSLNNWTMNYDKLLKIIYHSDVMFIKQCNNIISGDLHYSIKNGPIISRLHKFIENKLIPYVFNGDDICVTSDHSKSFIAHELSVAELDAIDPFYEHLDDLNIPTTCSIIGMFKSVGRSPTEIGTILEQAKIIYNINKSESKTIRY